MDLLQHLLALPQAKRQQIASDVHNKIRSTVGKAISDHPMHVAVLARYTYHLAVYLGEKKRKKTSSHLKPAWSAIRDLVNGFSEKHKDFPICVGVSSDDISNFATYATNRVGTQKPLLYFTLLLVFLTLRNDDYFGAQFFSTVCPFGERDFLEDCERLIINEYINTSEPLKSQINDDQKDFTEADINYRFNLNRDRLGSLSRYIGQFQSTRVNKQSDTREKSTTDAISTLFQEVDPPATISSTSLRRPKDDCGLHLIVYRPRVRNPAQLIKSFVSIYKDERDGADNRIYRFAHIYAPPKDAGLRKRISLGRVFPLNDALYLIGGQKHMVEDRIPFSSMKVICFTWSAIERRETNLKGLAMSSNNRGSPIVSRISARVTSISHSEDLVLGGVDIGEPLVNSIFEDFIAEEQYGLYLNDLSKNLNDENKERERDLAHEIINCCNNNPEYDVGWTVAGSYESVLKSKSSNPLDEDFVSGEIARSFGRKTNPKFKSQGGEVFDFWNSIRFGPMSSK